MQTGNFTVIPRRKGLDLVRGFLRQPEGFCQARLSELVIRRLRGAMARPIHSEADDRISDRRTQAASFLDRLMIDQLRVFEMIDGQAIRYQLGFDLVQ
jgi:hypothetical protein